VRRTFGVVGPVLAVAIEIGIAVGVEMRGIQGQQRGPTAPKVMAAKQMRQRCRLRFQ
jgi:hypothetical protein